MMSASSSSQNDDGSFQFSLNQPIPSYLVALAVGDLVSAVIGPRSLVWAEPCMLVKDFLQNNLNGSLKVLVLLLEV